MLWEEAQTSLEILTRSQAKELAHLRAMIRQRLACVVVSAPLFASGFEYLPTGNYCRLALSE
jgi:hypothetical protein